MKTVTYPRGPYQPDPNEPLLGFRFSVFFFMKGDKHNSMDIRFSKVSGIKARIDTQPLNEGGQNLFSYRLPTKAQYDNLVLERSMMIDTKLVEEFRNTLSLFKFNPSNVLVTLLDEAGSPITGWLFSTAYPVNWTFSDLDAGQNQVVIETMELAYQRMETVKL